MLLNAIPLVEDRVEELKSKVDELATKPKLVIVRIGEDPASAKYVANKQKLCARVGVESEIIHLDSQVSEIEVIKVLTKLNADTKISGVLLQLPIPKHLDEHKLTNYIAPWKDVDGFTIQNLGKLMCGIKAPRACTPAGIIQLLEYYGVELEGKDVLIINRSNIVGKPLALMLLEKNATPTIAHSKTRNLKSKTKKADIVITAIGKPNFLHWDDFNEDSIVVDVSINFDENGKMCGDVCKADYDSLNMITPVPNGVGRTTVLALIEQTINMHIENEKRVDQNWLK